MSLYGLIEKLESSHNSEVYFEVYCYLCKLTGGSAIPFSVSLDNTSSLDHTAPILKFQFNKIY